MIFYKLVDAGKFDAEFAEGVEWEEIKCPITKGHQRPGKRIGNLKVNLPSEKIPPFITTFLSDWIITERVAQLFKNSYFSGYKLKPVIVNNIEKGNKDEVPPLWELVVIGKGGDAQSTSGIHVIETCVACGLQRYSSFKKGIIIDEEQWDGSDFFTVNGYPKYILVTERVKDLIVSNKLSNIFLIPSDELIWPKNVIRPEDLKKE